MPTEGTAGSEAGDLQQPPIVELGDASGDEKSVSTLTVLVAFAANLLVAFAKSWAAALTGSASMVAEAAHSWADTGNEVFLMIANRRGGRRTTRIRWATGARPTCGR